MSILYFRVFKYSGIQGTQTSSKTHDSGFGAQLRVLALKASQAIITFKGDAQYQAPIDDCCKFWNFNLLSKQLSALQFWNENVFSTQRSNSLAWICGFQRKLASHLNTKVDLQSR